ncbi:MAG: alanyl-tRNA editing protein [Defluviitaleaceae bacterium]|nr:alanyl-tRNA editing protein [Defluviitaleaceae bacterium]
METKPLFWNDCYTHEFQATILEIRTNFIILNETYFYPQGGGQPGDVGNIAGIAIIDTKKSDGKILHYFDGECNLTAGQTVQCALDWPRRYTHMRIHAASHVMEYFLHETCEGLKFLSSFISGGKDTSAYEVAEAITAEHITIIEEKTNAFIKENHEIFLYADEAKPSYRYWKCGEITYPCGGTHPRNTSEIGEIALKVKGQASLGKQKIVTTLGDLI